MKTLVLVRHAHALAGWEARVNTDAERPLSPQGELKAVHTAQALQTLGIAPDVILTSPLVRAVQTARLLEETLQAPVRQEKMLNGLYPDGELRDFLLEQLQAYDTVLAHDGDMKFDTVLAVSHNPAVAYVTHLLCREVHPFAPGAFAVLRQEENNFRLSCFGE